MTEDNVMKLINLCLKLTEDKTVYETILQSIKNFFKGGERYMSFAEFCKLAGIEEEENENA